VGDVIVTIDTRRVKHTRNDCQGEVIADERKGGLIKRVRVKGRGREGVGIARGDSVLTTSIAHRGVDNSNAIIATENRTTLDGIERKRCVFYGKEGVPRPCPRPGRTRVLLVSPLARYFVFDTMSTL